MLKRSGVTEPFSVEKIITGLSRACQGRPVSQDQIAILANQVEDEVRALGSAQISSNDIGKAILEPLAELDAVSYLRYASVHSNFDLDDFEAAVKRLQGERNSAVSS